MVKKQTDKQDSIGEEVVMESTQSQIIETGFMAKQATDTKVEPVPEKESKIKFPKKRSLDILLVKLFAAMLIAAIFVLIGYNELDLINKNHYQLQEQIAEQSAQKIAAGISQRVTLFQQKFNRFELEKMQDGEVKNSEKLFPGSQILYFSLPLKHNAIVDNPAQGYIFLDLLNELYKSKTETVSSMDIIKPNTEHSAIIIAKKELDKDEKNTGIYVLIMPTQFSQQLLDNIDLFNGAVELTQGQTSAIKLSSKGPGINNAIIKSHQVDNTHWRVNYSHNLNRAGISLSAYLLFAIYAVLSLICLLIASFFATKYLNKFRQERQKQKQIKNMKSENLGHSVLKNKESISKLGMNKSELLVDKTIALKDKRTAAGVGQKADNELDTGMITDYGIRGVFGKHINAIIFTHLAHAIAQEMENNDLTQICIGHDNRITSEELYQALLEGFKPYDIKIIGLGLVSLPVVYYVALTQTNGNALMVTAGSSTAEYNGLKILLNNEIYTKQQLNSLINIVPEEGPQLFHLESSDCNHLYINHITEKFNLQKKLNVVVDFANSVSSQIIFDLFKMLGCNVIPIFEEMDGNFPNHAPHPGKPENLQLLAEKVKAESADIGLAFNSDGSALGVVASNGDIIWNDRILMLLARDLLQNKPGAKVMYDVKSTSSLHDWIIGYKGEPELSPSGCSAIKQRMDANHALLGGEFSGHLFFAEHANGLDDAFYAAAKILQIVSAYDGNSTSLFKEIPEKISTPEVLIAVQPGQEAEIIEKILSQKAEFQPAGIITLDGLRVEYEDGWGMVRQSRTTSSLSLRFEADTPQVLQRIAEKFKEVILSVVFVKFPY